MEHRSILQSTCQQAIKRLGVSKRWALPLVALPLVAAALLTPAPARADLDKIVNYEDVNLQFNDQNPGNWWGDLSGLPNRFSVVNTDGARGSRSAKFVFTKEDFQTTNPDTGKHYDRTEVGNPSVGKVGEERWIAFAVKLPDTWQVDSNFTIVTQMKSHPDGTHWGPNEPAKSPHFSLEVDDNNWRIASRYDPQRLNTATGTDGSITPNFTVLSPWNNDRGKWTYWVVRVRWSFNPNEADPDKKGFLQIWKNGNLLIDDTGPNCYNDQQFDGGQPMFLRQGIYKPTYDKRPYDQGGSPDVITVFHDETRLGKRDDSSYAEVMPMNVLRNPGFENNPGTVENSVLHDDYWEDEPGDSLAVKSNAHSGSWSMRLGASSGGPSSKYQGVLNGVAAGQNYTLSGWGKVAASGGRGRLVVRCLDINGNTIGGANPDGLGRFFTPDFTATGYVQKSVSFTTPAGTTALRVILVNDAASTSYFYVDDLVLQNTTPGI